MQISSSVQAVLSNAIIGKTSVQLPEGKLDRALYADVDKVLKAMGGKWNRSTKKHEFVEELPADAMDRALTTGTVINRKQELGAFYTPSDLAALIVSEARIETGMDVLEPSAGAGALAYAAEAAGGKVWVCEIDCAVANKHLLLKRGLTFVHCGDFLKMDIEPQFDRVVMNPPFAKQADIEHVTYAFGALKPGGRLVAIMSAGVMNRQDRKSTTFRDFVAAMGGSIVPLPAGSFKESGTAVATVMVTIERPQ